VEPWAREQWIEQGERKWSPHQAKLTVLEGPPLPVEELSMGRGWRAAQRQSQDVTARMLAAVDEGSGGGSVGAVSPPGGASLPGGAPSTHDEGLLADSLGLELLGQLASGPAPLRRAWELAVARHPERTISQCLALGERAIASLLESRLIVLARGDGAEGTQRQVDGEEIQAVLRSVDSWSAGIVSVIRR
jgi:hypothetical protein